MSKISKVSKKRIEIPEEEESQEEPQEEEPQEEEVQEEEVQEEVQEEEPVKKGKKNRINTEKENEADFVNELSVLYYTIKYISKHFLDINSNKDNMVLNNIVLSKQTIVFIKPVATFIYKVIKHNDYSIIFTLECHIDNDNLLAFIYKSLSYIGKKFDKTTCWSQNIITNVINKLTNNDLTYTNGVFKKFMKNNNNFLIGLIKVLNRMIIDDNMNHIDREKSITIHVFVSVLKNVFINEFIYSSIESDKKNKEDFTIKTLLMNQSIVDKIIHFK